MPDCNTRSSVNGSINKTDGDRTKVTIKKGEPKWEVYSTKLMVVSVRCPRCCGPRDQPDDNIDRGELPGRDRHIDEDRVQRITEPCPVEQANAGAAAAFDDTGMLLKESAAHSQLVSLVWKHYSRVCATLNLVLG